MLLEFSCCCFFFFKQKTAYEMRISDWSSDVCSSDLQVLLGLGIDLGHIADHEEAEGEDREERQEGEVGHRTCLEVSLDRSVVLVHPHQVVEPRTLGAQSGHLEAQAFLERGHGVSRSEERRVGKECVSTCGSRGSPDP